MRAWELTMTRRRDKDGNPSWVPPLTEEEELERFALCGELPFARL